MLIVNLCQIQELPDLPSVPGVREEKADSAEESSFIGDRSPLQMLTVVQS